jgi:nitric oxide reductase large subunit
MSEIQISQPRITWLLVALGAIAVMNTVPVLVTYFEYRWPLVSLGAAASIWMFVAAQPRESWRDRVNPAIMEGLVWARVPGDVVFAVGVGAFALFVWQAFRSRTLDDSASGASG